MSSAVIGVQRRSSAVPSAAWLHRYAIFTACATLFLLVAGALVTGNDAGLSVPDWPLSYGKLMPPMVGGIFYEHGHRLVATTVGLLTIGLALWLWRSDPRPWLRRLGWIALGLVIAQGLLGGITVLFYLPLWVSTAHACLAQAFFCLTVAIAMFTSPRWGDRAGAWAGDRGLQKLALATVAAIFGQLLVGALYRHDGLGMIPHLSGAAIVTVLVFWTMVRALRRGEAEPGVTTAAVLLTGLLLTQLFLGGGSLAAKLYYADAPQPMPVFVWITTVHLAMGALTLAASVALALLLFRAPAAPVHPAPRSQPVAPVAGEVTP
jgi:cytochrome c oxidase assembly protein subunit 15